VQARFTSHPTGDIAFEQAARQEEDDEYMTKLDVVHAKCALLPVMFLTIAHVQRVERRVRFAFIPGRYGNLDPQIR